MVNKETINEQSKSCCNENQECCSETNAEPKEDSTFCNKIAEKAIKNTENIVLGYD